jgi:quinol monooxygenase YgiN
MLEKVVRIAVNVTVNEGQQEPFKELVTAMTAGSEAEAGTLGYEWFFSEDGKTCRLLETYADVNAVTAHFAGPVVRQMVPQMIPLCKLDSFEIYGDPGTQVSQIAAGMGARIYSYWAGLSR